MTGVAIACQSFREVERAGAGGIGVWSSPLLTQHTGVTQFLKSHPVQQHEDFFVSGVPAFGSAELVKTPCPARMIPSRSTTIVFTKRDLMASDGSLRTANPYASCHFLRQKRTVS